MIIFPISILPVGLGIMCWYPDTGLVLAQQGMLSQCRVVVGPALETLDQPQCHIFLTSHVCFNICAGRGL